MNIAKCFLSNSAVSGLKINEMFFEVNLGWVKKPGEGQKTVGRENMNKVYESMWEMNDFVQCDLDRHCLWDLQDSNLHTSYKIRVGEESLIL